MEALAQGRWLCKSRWNQLQKYEKENCCRCARMRLLGTSFGSQLQKSPGLPAQSGVRRQCSTLTTSWHVVSGCRGHERPAAIAQWFKLGRHRHCHPSEVALFIGQGKPARG